MKQSIQKIIIAAVLFAAGLSNISANAQESDGVMQEARAEVYELTKQVVSGLNLGQPFLTVIPNIPAESQRLGLNNNYGVVDFILTRANEGDINPTVDPNNLGPNDLLQFGTDGMYEEMKPGDRFIVRNPDDSFKTVATVYVYAISDDFAFAESTGNTAATTGTDEFFLDRNWKETTEFSADLQGLIAAECNPGYVLNPDDMTSCVIPPNCGTGAILNGIVCECETGFEELNTQTDPQTCEPIPGGTQTQTSGGGSSSTGLIVGGIVVVGGLVWLLSSGGEEGEFNFSPDFGYSLTESGYSANVGGRADFRKDNWHFYYSANQQNANGNFADFRYESGGKYTADFWTATFSESVAGDTADYDFSLSSDFGSGIWKLSPVYRLHSEWKESDSGIKTETQNELNLESVLRYNRWTIRPSAGFRWENANDFSKNARFQINAIHRF